MHRICVHFQTDYFSQHCLLFTRFIQIIRASDGRLNVEYDGSDDRQQQPVVNTLLTDPRPLLYEDTAHENKAEYTAADHADKLEGQFADLKVINPDFVPLSLTTDNENTMRALGTEMKNRIGLERVGGGPHGMNKVIGMSSMKTCH